MPLWVLVIIVAIGLTLVIGAVHVFGGKRVGSLDEGTAKDTWQQEFGDDPIGIIVSDDRSDAFLTLQTSDAIGLVRQMGAHHIARRLEGGSVDSIAETDEGLDVRLSETTLPLVRFAIGDDEERAKAIAMLEKLTTTEGQIDA